MDEQINAFLASSQALAVDDTLKEARECKKKAKDQIIRYLCENDRTYVKIDNSTFLVLKKSLKKPPMNVDFFKSCYADFVRNEADNFKSSGLATVAEKFGEYVFAKQLVDANRNQDYTYNLCLSDKLPTGDTMFASLR